MIFPMKLPVTTLPHFLARFAAISGALLLAGLFSASGEEVRVRLDMPGTDVRDLLEFYQHITGRPVFMAADLHALVEFESQGDIPRDEAIALIRKKLLETYGIEMRDNGRGEILVAWSNDPKHPHRSKAPENEAGRKYFQRMGIQIIEPPAAK
jgi:hypothetical protein